MLVSMQNRIQQMPINNIGRNKSNQINFQGQWGNKVVEEHLNEIVNKKTIASMQGLLEGVFTGLKKARTLDLLEAMAEKISDLTKSLNESQQEANSTKQELSQKTKDNGNLTDRNNWLQQAVTNLQNLKTENEKEIAGLNEKVNELEKFKTKFGEIKPMSQVEGLTPEEVIDTMQQLHDNRTEYFEALDNYLFDNDSTNKGFDPKLLDVLHNSNYWNKQEKKRCLKLTELLIRQKNFGVTIILMLLVVMQLDLLLI